MEQRLVATNNFEADSTLNIKPSNPYKFKLEAFEGPLDLLLHLIRKEKIDIYDIPISEITKQYMTLITTDKLKTLDLDLAGEYLLMASTLAQIKSRLLLPVETNEEEQTDDFEKDPRTELVKKLLEYQRFKDAALKISSIPRFRENTYPFGHNCNFKIDNEDSEISSEDVDIFLLLSYFHNLVEKLPDETSHEIEKDTTTVSQRILEILEILKKSSSQRIEFSTLFSGYGKSEIIITFLSILELTRLKYIRIYQPIEGQIWINKNFDPENIDMNLMNSIETSYYEKKHTPDGDNDSTR